MRRDAVRDVLIAMHIPFASGPHGFDLRVHGANCRLESGGGIAGRSGDWRIAHRSGCNATRSVCRKRDLRRLLTEWMAGDPPEPPPGHKLYARVNHNRFGDSYVWCLKRLPLGAAQ